jgi:hypothetical protein
MQGPAHDDQAAFIIGQRSVMQELDDVGPGSLKLVVAAEGAEQVLRKFVHEKHIRPLEDRAWIVFTEAPPADVRDWLVAALGEATQVFVVEFEHWSARGDIDGAWLLRRGH